MKYGLVQPEIFDLNPPTQGRKHFHQPLLGQILQSHLLKKIINEKSIIFGIGSCLGDYRIIGQDAMPGCIE